MIQVFYVPPDRGADPTGFEPAISALTGPHVWPLHHGSMRAVVYYTTYVASSYMIYFVVYITWT